MPNFLQRRYQPPFHPVHRLSPFTQALTAVERFVKGMLFNCTMCGNCILPETAFVCPMTCPRGLRNGHCRGSSQHRCFIDPANTCTWFHIYQQSEERGTLENLLEVHAPLDNQQLGCETSLNTWRFRKKQKCGPHLSDFLNNRVRFVSDWKTLCHDLRQPDWWQGDSSHHPPAYSEPTSWFETALQRRRFAISAEVAPPMEPSGERVAKTARRLRKWVDTVNFTDNPLGVPRMSGLACAMLSLDEGMEPVLQIQTRHRSRYAFEAEAMGAATVGVKNILCMSDDIGRLGPGPSARPEINDIDTIQALWILRRLRDEGVDVDGNTIDHKPQYFLGAIASPSASIPRYEALVTEKKINAGAQFLQTLPVFHMSRFDDWLEALDKRNLLDKVYLMPTVTPIARRRHARFMADYVPGVHIPASIMKRMENTTNPQEEGIQIALEFIAQLSKTYAIHGLHILAPHQEEVVPRLVRESGINTYKLQKRTGKSLLSTKGKNNHRNGNGHKINLLPSQEIWQHRRRNI